LDGSNDARDGTEDPSKGPLLFWRLIWIEASIARTPSEDSDLPIQRSRSPMNERDLSGHAFIIEEVPGRVVVTAINNYIPFNLIKDPILRGGVQHHRVSSVQWVGVESTEPIQSLADLMLTNANGRVEDLPLKVGQADLIVVNKT
jgi:hypothetical protein